MLVKLAHQSQPQWNGQNAQCRNCRNLLSLLCNSVINAFCSQLLWVLLSRSIFPVRANFSFFHTVFWSSWQVLNEAIKKSNVASKVSFLFLCFWPLFDLCGLCMASSGRLCFSLVKQNSFFVTAAQIISAICFH